MKRRILLVDDEVAVLLTLKAVLEISGFDVDTAASAREGVSRLHTREYHMLITDMRMESDEAGVEVIRAARAAAYHPAIALLTAFPVADEDWQQMGADQLLVKPMHTRILLQQIEDLIAAHDAKLARMGVAPSSTKPPVPAKNSPTRESAASKPAKPAARRASKPAKIAKKKPTAGKAASKKAPAKKSPTKTIAARKSAKTASAARRPAKKAAKSRRK